jgi:hypothetical protein
VLKVPFAECRLYNIVYLRSVLLQQVELVLVYLELAEGLKCD